ncbi:two-component sensor histidine kinase [Mycolicibacterium duvalii]|uniref:Signal transduction histidine-protein kinase/phosphatase MprB n=1 Tax=Mycolicibacterium duvalii TaxID=39688 RepID=A0A7I7K9Z3_9MYCO|nr:HAMP domain-containing sensor histidine kinase [Mycolicibacterium duvalii]MCV7368344.1 HAMP domain-containing histidine kinase [Mycolicibacterium duvalii]PEG35689.1 two-component sensor histidine kinase [Mycolicibacterium duvalii]BBX20444.1 signal transduction histidine-protein kinase/phosphatase MprB [Mycolicibacterium duvalii]
MSYGNAGPWPPRLRPPPPTSSLSVRWRVMLLAMSMVVMVVLPMFVAVYAVVSRALYDDIDTQLRTRAQLLVESGSLSVDPAKAIEGTAFSDINAIYYVPGRVKYTYQQPGQTLPIGGPERDVMEGKLLMSLRSVSRQRVLALHIQGTGSSLLLSKSLEPTRVILQRLGSVLLIIGSVGVAVAAIAGGMVARAALRPVARLTEAAERVARTSDLRPIQVFGSDELARMTETFNMMLGALAESRDRQSRLVADAGHELRTPLTSLRTNVELLMASQKPGAPRLPEQEMAELQADVIAQIEELSTLVGDLVDLTRADAGGVIHETVEMGDVIERSLERVRRRRNDIDFDVAVTPWQVYGDAAGLARAVLNLLDNAAKWSPPGGRVDVRLTQVDPLRAELVVSDQGPGIPPQERHLVFERFYRSTAARAMPGSGLGLAIVKQVVVRHGGALYVTDTVPGGQPPGTSMHVLFPGRPSGYAVDSDSESDVSRDTR